jgi:hypothetical protein
VHGDNGDVTLATAEVGAQRGLRVSRLRDLDDWAKFLVLMTAHSS